MRSFFSKQNIGRLVDFQAYNKTDSN